MNFDDLIPTNLEDHIGSIACETSAANPEMTISETALISIAANLERIANSLARISECADGVHPSQFRITGSI